MTLFRTGLRVTPPLPVAKIIVAGLACGALLLAVMSIVVWAQGVERRLTFIEQGGQLAADMEGD